MTEKKRRRQNSPERAAMLADRYVDQRNRKPALRMVGAPYWINPKTG